MMKTQEMVQQDEERIRKLVRALPDEQRLLFFTQTEKELKDPDTYATLNYLFIAGLHHFYLGKWLRGSLNLGVFLCGVILLMLGITLFGAVLLIAITLVELKALFQSQVIVQEYNNAVMEAIYRRVSQDGNSINNL